MITRHPDFFEQIERNNYIAQVCYECGYKDIVKEKVVIDQECNFNRTYMFKECMYEYPDDDHYISYIDKKSIIIYREQYHDCCNAKKGDIVICVAYTDEKYRNNGFMTKLLFDLKESIDKQLVIDTETKELIKICKKLGIKSFKWGF